MPTTYAAADQPTLDLLAQVLLDHHRPLHDAGVRVGVLFASNEDGIAVTHGGYPALATMKVISLKDRVFKGVDAEMLVDLSGWDDLTPPQRVALLDHECSHIALKKYGYSSVLDADGEPTGETLLHCDRDDLDRPKLAGVKGDFNAGDAFRAVIARHGRAAVEFVNARRFHEFASDALESAPAAPRPTLFEREAS